MSPTSDSATGNDGLPLTLGVAPRLPVVHSGAARALFLLSAATTIAILWWAHDLGSTDARHQLTPIFLMLFILPDQYAAMGLLLILVVAALVSREDGFGRPLTWIGTHPRSIAAAAAAVLCAGTLLIYRNHPFAMDEYAAFFQSQVFSAGRLAGQFPPELLDWLVPRWFQNYFLIVSPQSGAVASAYWPAFSLLLAPFTWLRIPWACNPVISACTLLVIHRLALEMLGDRQAAGFAVLATLASPVFFADGISYYAMPAHLLANGLYALLLLRPEPRRVFLAGLIGSVALTLHNPVPHMLFCVPWLFWVVRRERGERLLLWLCLGYTPLCALLGVGWALYCGHLAQAGGVSGVHAGVAAALQRYGAAFALPDSAVLLARLVGLAKVWLWAVPGLVVLAIAGAWRRWGDTRFRLLVISALLTLIGYLFVPVDQGHGWGYRYFHSAWLALPLLAAAALAPAADSLATPGRASLFANLPTRTFAVACALLTLVFGVGQRAWQIHQLIALDLAQLPASAGPQPQVVFLDVRLMFYGADLVQNEPFLREHVIRMLSHGADADAALMKAHFPRYHRAAVERNATVWIADAAVATR